MAKCSCPKQNMISPSGAVNFQLWANNSALRTSHETWSLSVWWELPDWTSADVIFEKSSKKQMVDSSFLLLQWCSRSISLGEVGSGWAVFKLPFKIILEGEAGKQISAHLDRFETQQMDNSYSVVCNTCICFLTCLVLRDWWCFTNLFSWVWYTWGNNFCCILLSILYALRGKQCFVSQEGTA